MSSIDPLKILRIAKYRDYRPTEILLIVAVIVVLSEHSTTLQRLRAIHPLTL